MARTSHSVIRDDLRAESPSEGESGSRVAGKRVLMISQAFPPTGGPGVQRSSKFAKYLARYGWRPVVWSADRLIQLPGDDSLLDDLPSDLIRYRSRPLSHASIHHALMRPLQATASRRGSIGRLVRGVDWRLQRGLRSFGERLIPDESVGWAISSVVPLLRIIRRERIEALYSTYSPISNHVLACWLKRLTGLPWVSDYRDLWIDDYCYNPRGRLRAWYDRRLQDRLLRCADVVVGVSAGQTERLASRVPAQRSKFRTITNGVDLAEIAGIDRARAADRLHGPADRFLLTFVGLFVANRTTPGLFDGMGMFAQWIKERGGSFEFRLVGGISDQLRDRFKKLGVPLTETGYLPHVAAIEQMMASDLLLLVVPPGPKSTGFMTGKVYEYLATGRPVLLIGPECGPARNLVMDSGAGINVTGDRDKVFGALKTLWTDWNAGRLELGCDAQRIEPYSRERLAGQLAEILSEACSPCPQPALRPALQA